MSGGLTCGRTGDYCRRRNTTALTTAQLVTFWRFSDRLDLSAARMDGGSKSGQRFASQSRIARSLGVNRISLGVQSWDDELLKLLGREHNAAQAEVSHLARGGFRM